MEEPDPAAAIYSTVDMAFKHKNRRNSKSAGGRGRGKKLNAPPRRPPPTPPTPPTAYAGNTIIPPAVAVKSAPQATTESTIYAQVTEIPVKPSEDSPSIPQKSPELLVALEKQRNSAPPKPVPYHIYIVTKKMSRSSITSAGMNKQKKDKGRVIYDTDSDSDDSDT